jgi:hypothetical protein
MKGNPEHTGRKHIRIGSLARYNSAFVAVQRFSRLHCVIPLYFSRVDNARLVAPEVSCCCHEVL